MRRFGVYLFAFAVVSCHTVDTDVVIIGGGTAGVAAAVQAARCGAETMLVEETSWLGGMLTSAGVSCIDGNYNLRGGIFGEFTDSLASRYGGYDALKTGWVSNINFEPHVGAEIFDNMVTGCGSKLQVLKGASLCGLQRVSSRKSQKGELASKWRKRRTWKGSILTAEGKVKFRAGAVLDATELGDVASRCGLSARIGMDSAAETGEDIAPPQSNATIQDMTYVAILKDYGPNADRTIPEPSGYDRNNYVNSCLNPLNDHPDPGRVLWSVPQMISYGALPGGKYMVNWPIEGNDYYANTIEMNEHERDSVYRLAKLFTLGFVHFIQKELGYKNLGLADDEFPTEDSLAFFPYHRESRRVDGEAFFTMDAAAAPYEYHLPYYRTSVAVGDYAVDHHHYRNPDYKNLPDLHFYPIPSFSVPIGVMLPKDCDDILVIEKSLSVSNLINGATRLQPVVMGIGQVAGMWAAIAAMDGCSLREVPIRHVQAKLLDAGCYLLPYLDLKPSDRHFSVLQRVGATGILRGKGMNVGWANQTWFRISDPLLYDELYLADYYPEAGRIEQMLDVDENWCYSTSMTIADMERIVSLLAKDSLPGGFGTENWWESMGLVNYVPCRAITRLEAAVLIDSILHPFVSRGVDYSGFLLDIR